MTTLAKHPPEVSHWVYNGLDTMMPLEILAEIRPKLTDNQRAYYDFSRAMQGPAKSMMLTGVKVSMAEVSNRIKLLERDVEILLVYVRSLAVAVWGDGLNVNSPDQMKEFFYYSEDGFQIKPKYEGKGNKRHITTNRNALEKIAREYYYARPVCEAIFELKDTESKLQFLRRGIDSDGRVRCSFNVVATETGRWSSSKNPWGGGGNFQNQTEEIRKIYIADEGWMFGAPDLAQAESRGVAYYSGDRAYIKAVESGDLHTQVAKMVWPELEWANDNGPEDRKVADAPFYRHFSYRDMAKRGGHGTNYLGTAFTMAQHLKVAVEVMEEFQSKYFNVFARIRRWHGEIQRELQDCGVLRTALGRGRTFFSRLDSDATLKEAVAFLPQSLISDIFKIGFYRVWREYEMRRSLVKLQADIHDGGLMLIKIPQLDEVAEGIIKLMTIPVAMPGGKMTIPVDLSVGHYWIKDKKDERKMKDWEPGIAATMQPPNEFDSYLQMSASDIG
jgi:DNA polymerase-1